MIIKLTPKFYIMANNKLPAFGTGAFTEAHKAMESKEILTTGEAACFMGISKNYLYVLNSKRLIPFFSPNNKMNYYRREDLENYMLSNKRKSSKSILQKASNTFLTSKF